MNLNKQLTVLIACTLMLVKAAAYPTSNYASSSRLATGHWVKVAIPADGMYQITAEELDQMGFSDIEKVQVYGYGGHILPHEFTGMEEDDLMPVPVLVSNKKLCFYAKGPLKVTFNTSGDFFSFTRKVNAYSTMGYYFLTEGDTQQRVEQFNWSSSAAATRHKTSYNWFLHERELSTFSWMGKDLLGENLMDQPCYVNYNLPNLASSTLAVQTSVAVSSTTSIKNSTYYSIIDASLIAGGQTVPLDYSATHISYNRTGLVRYEQESPTIEMSLPSLQETGQIKIDKVQLRPVGTTVLTLGNCALDYVLISYEQNNTLSKMDASQQAIFLPTVNNGDIIEIANASATTQIWNLNGPYPISLGKNANTNEFSIPMSLNGAQCVAFDPEGKLHSIDSYEVVPNQDIHSQPTPDFIIVANKDFMEAAQSLANLHHTHDGMDVLTVSQDEVFNEFSSGTPDAMAVRRMCKMFYDRDATKLKYLLMFGQGTFDNRHLVSKKTGTVITYETDESYSESNCYASDDVFGILDDGSGRNFASEYIRLGVGRLTPADINEAKSDVIKIAKYITDPDYGPWRNRALIIADQGAGESDSTLHIYQAEGICKIIKEEKNIMLEQSKAFVPFFPKAIDEDLLVEERRSCPESKHYVASALCNGQYFASYVGHASSTGFTGLSKTWQMSDVNGTSYKHFPIMTTACCDVARFDDVKRGIAEHMMHKSDGGAIALLTSTREVDAMWNDRLNKAFTRAFFTPNEDGTMPTLGDVNKISKQSFGTSENKNKMMFAFLGDPAMRINYPLNRIVMTKVNGTTIASGETSVSVSPMQYINVEAQVMNADGTAVDKTFNGVAYITLFDAERFFKTTNGVIYTQPYDIYYPRTQIAQVDATITNGMLKASILVPHDLPSEGNLQLSIYSHNPANDLMVNGVFSNLVPAPFNAGIAETDTQSPVITEMFFDNADEFAETATIATDGMIHITATDETALSMSSSITGEMKLVLDGGAKSYYLVKNFATISDNGKRVTLSMPVTGLNPGRHTLTFSVMDVAGNSSSKTIDFIVEQPTNVVLAVDEIAATDKATFVIAKNNLSELPELTIKVTDVAGNIVWQKTTSSFPCEWNLTGNNGRRVANGVYRYWATYDNDVYYGGTPKSDLVIVAP